MRMPSRASAASRAGAKVKQSITRLGGGTTSQGVSFPGGLDQVTPALALQPGALRDGVNFEVSQSGGYGRIPGYERFDGRPSPSSASFGVVQVTAFTNVPAVGQTLSQAVSGATGVIVAVHSSGFPFYVAVTKVAGTFDAIHAVLVGATPIGTAITTMVALSSKEVAQYTAAAADAYRPDIGAVPGSGPMRGVVGMVFSGADNVYAFRDNAGATAVDVYKKTNAGWVQVPLFKIVEFNTGNAATPTDGQVLTQGGVTATVKRVMWRSGSWTGTAAGGFVVTAPAGGNFVAGAATLSGGATVALLGAQTSIVITPGGKYEFAKYNFSGSTTTKRIYGVDGVNKAFEFDGETYAPITTGLSPDNPRHLACHKNFLFLSKGSSIIHPGAGTPFKFSAIDGGGEIATGDDVSGMVTLPGSQTTATLAVYQESNTNFLYGTDPATFNLVSFNTGAGALPYSIQNLFDTFVFDSLGVITIQTSLNYGNFLPSTLTKNILPLILQERSRIACSCVSRDKSQYRVFFSDGNALWITVVNKSYLGPAAMQFPNPVACVDEVETASAGHAIYFGSSDSLGYVYQMDVGTSFDGAEINAYITLAWDFFKSPGYLKKYRAARVEIQGNAYAEMSFGYQLGYGSPDIAQPAFVLYPSNFSGAPVWDQFVWDNFFWDGRVLFPTNVPLEGSAENIQVTISTVTNYIAPFNVNSIMYNYSPLRIIRV